MAEAIDSGKGTTNTSYTQELPPVEVVEIQQEVIPTEHGDITVTKRITKRKKIRVTHNVQQTIHETKPPNCGALMDEDADELYGNNLAVLNLQQQASHRRESFLYRTLEGENEDGAPNTPAFTSFTMSDGSTEDILTPFAQILSRLQTVRENIEKLVEMSSSVHNTAASSQVGHRASFGSDKPTSSVDAAEILNGSSGSSSLLHTALEELEWCLKRLEKMHIHQTAGDLAMEKFTRLLSKELSNVADTSKAGTQISEYLLNTYMDHSEIDLRNFIDAEKSSVANNSLAACEPEQQLPGQPLASAIRTSSSGTFKPLLSPAGMCRLSQSGLTFLLDVDLKSLLQSTISMWGMDVFKVNRLSDEHPLVAIAYEVFQAWNLLHTFEIPADILLNCILHIEEQYHKTNTYHNAIHAADVTQSMHVMLQAAALKNIFTDLEIFAALFASIVHDVDHPGVTNQYLINTANELAILYNDESVLENHHVAVAFTILQNDHNNILKGLSRMQQVSFRKMVIAMVLATDMTKHMTLLADLTSMTETRTVSGSSMLPIDNYTDRKMILQSMLHCADLSNPTKPLPVYRQWVHRIMEEFYAQGDKEKLENLDISPMCDRESATVEKSQISFITFIVYPLWEAWSKLVHTAAQEIMNNLCENREWYTQNTPQTPKGDVT